MLAYVKGIETESSPLLAPSPAACQQLGPDRAVLKLEAQSRSHMWVAETQLLVPSPVH